MLRECANLVHGIIMLVGVATVHNASSVICNNERLWEINPGSSLLYHDSMSEVYILVREEFPFWNYSLG